MIKGDKRNEVGLSNGEFAKHESIGDDSLNLLIITPLYCFILVFDSQSKLWCDSLNLQKSWLL